MSRLDSDLDHAEYLHGPDLRELADREDEQARADRWAAFTAWAAHADVPTMLEHVARLMRGRTDPYYGCAGIDQRFTDFAETEGWSGVLSAIARVRRAAETE